MDNCEFCETKLPLRRERKFTNKAYATAIVGTPICGAIVFLTMYYDIFVFGHTKFFFGLGLTAVPIGIASGMKKNVSVRCTKCKKTNKYLG